MATLLPNNSVIAFGPPDCECSCPPISGSVTGPTSGTGTGSGTAPGGTVTVECCPGSPIAETLTLTVVNHELIPSPTTVTLPFGSTGAGGGGWANFSPGGFDVSTGGGVFIGPGGLTYRVLCTLTCNFPVSTEWRLAILTHIQGEPEPTARTWVNAALVPGPSPFPYYICAPFHVHAEYGWFPGGLPPQQIGTYDITE